MYGELPGMAGESPLGVGSAVRPVLDPAGAMQKSCTVKGRDELLLSLLGSGAAGVKVTSPTLLFSPSLSKELTPFTMPREERRD